jgi:hypothetical protein
MLKVVGFANEASGYTGKITSVIQEDLGITYRLLSFEAKQIAYTTTRPTILLSLVVYLLPR